MARQGVAGNLETGKGRAVVYFVRAVTMRNIKIGVATDMRKRLTALQCGSPDTLELLGTYECADALAEEGRLHRQFKTWRMHGEWFHPGGDLLAFIKERTGWVQRMGPAPRGAGRRLTRHLAEARAAERSLTPPDFYPPSELTPSD